MTRNNINKNVEDIPRPWIDVELFGLRICWDCAEACEVLGCVAIVAICDSSSTFAIGTTKIISNCFFFSLRHYEIRITFLPENGVPLEMNPKHFSNSCKCISNLACGKLITMSVIEVSMGDNFVNFSFFRNVRGFFCSVKTSVLEPASDSECTNFATVDLYHRWLHDAGWNKFISCFFKNAKICLHGSIIVFANSQLQVVFEVWMNCELFMKIYAFSSSITENSTSCMRAIWPFKWLNAKRVNNCL